MNMMCFDISGRNIGVCSFRWTCGEWNPFRIDHIVMPKRQTLKKMMIKYYEQGRIQPNGYQSEVDAFLAHRMVFEIQNLCNQVFGTDVIDFAVWESPYGGMSIAQKKLFGLISGVVGSLFMSNRRFSCTISVKPSEVKKAANNDAKIDIVHKAMKLYPDLIWNKTGNLLVNEHCADALFMGMVAIEKDEVKFRERNF